MAKRNCQLNNQKFTPNMGVIWHTTRTTSKNGYLAKAVFIPRLLQHYKDPDTLSQNTG